MPAALLGRVLAVAGVVVLVLSPAATVATVATAGRDAIGQEREPCAVDRADDIVVSGRRLAGDPPAWPAEQVGIVPAVWPGSALADQGDSGPRNLVSIATPGHRACTGQGGGDQQG